MLKHVVTGYLALVCCGGMAAETRLSLAPVLDALTSPQSSPSAEPGLECPGALALESGPRAKFEWKREIRYPFTKFAASPGGKHFAVTVAKSELPPNSVHDRSVVIGTVTGTPQRTELLGTLPAVNDAFPTDPFFLNDSWLGVTWLRENGDELERKLEFYNVDTKERVDATTLIRLDGKRLVAMRTFAGRFVLVHWARTTGASPQQGFTFYHLAGPAKLTPIGDLNSLGLTPTQIAVQIFHNVVDERQVFSSADGLRIFYSLPDKTVEGGWRETSLYVTPHTVTSRVPRVTQWGPALPIDDQIEFSRVITADRTVAVLDAHGNVVGKWKTAHTGAFERLTRIEGGYLTFYANHPRYGTVFLKDDGAVVELTASTRRLIHHTIGTNAVIGTSDMTKQGIDLVIVPK